MRHPSRNLRSGFILVLLAAAAPLAAQTSGDFNGDGMDELAMGAPYEDLVAIGDAGEVQVRYGPLPVISGTTQAWNQDSAMVADSAEASDWFGRALR
ncbi:MAG: hypothetical protein EYC70_01770 [Planctomycetota bacterium]|nr:MAG: hypothetical protein EYC70_01770 [Planctomycetota bacterium]